MDQFSREANSSAIDEDVSVSFHNQREMEEEWGNKIQESDYPKANLNDSPRLFELLHVLLDKIRDGSGVPLSRVVRTNLLVEEERLAHPMSGSARIALCEP